MAIPSRTLGELVGRVAFAIQNDAEAEDALKTEIKWAIAWTLYDLINEYDHPAFKTEGTITTVAGTQAYDMPDDFVRLIDPGVKHASSPFESIRYIQQQEWDQMGGDFFNQSQGRPLRYTLMGRQGGISSTFSGNQIIKLFQTPDAAYNLAFTYFAMPDDMATLDDSAEIDMRYPRQFVQGLYWGALTHFSQHLAEDQFLKAEKKFHQVMRSMKANARAVTGAKHRKRRYSRGPDYPGEQAWPHTLSGNFN